MIYSSITIEPNGKILCITTGNGDFLVYNDYIIAIDYESNASLFSGNMDDFYYSEGLVINRPSQTITLDKTTFIANGVDSITITGAVTGSTMTIKGKIIPEQSGTCDNPDYFITELPDTYTLTISNFPYLDFVVTIEAT